MRKRVPRAGKRVRGTPLPLFGVSQKYQANKHNIYSEDLWQTCAGSVFGASVSVCPYKLYLVDYVGHVLLAFLTPLAPIILSPLLLCYSLSSKERGLMEISTLCSFSELHFQMKTEKRSKQ